VSPNQSTITELESTHRVQTSTNAVRYPSNSVTNIHPQLFQFVFNACNTRSLNDRKGRIDPGSKSRSGSVTKSNPFVLGRRSIIPQNLVQIRLYFLRYPVTNTRTTQTDRQTDRQYYIISANSLVKSTMNAVSKCYISYMCLA